jgi:hypothetical protein
MEHAYKVEHAKADRTLALKSKDRVEGAEDSSLLDEEDMPPPPYSAKKLVSFCYQQVCTCQ